jgi:dTMP kinase
MLVTTAAHMTRGKFITFEGGEGSGKSTQARLLADRLAAWGIAAILTREPGGSPFAEQVRALVLDSSTEPHSPLSEALLFYAARADHLEKTIRPALAEGRWVICDRFSDSTRVYQGIAGGLNKHVIDLLDDLVVKPTFPELTFVLEVHPQAGMLRVQQRRIDAAQAGEKVDAYEGRDLAFHSRLRSGFLEVANANPQRCVVIQGYGDAQQLSAEIWGHVERRLLQGMP